MTIEYEIDNFINRIPEEKVINYDWQGNPLYYEDECFNVNGEYVKEEDVLEYINDTYGISHTIEEYEHELYR